MLLPKIKFILILELLTLICNAQIKVDHSIIFISNDSTKRNLLGLSPVYRDSNLISLGDLISNRLVYVNSIGSNLINGLTPIIPQYYPIGFNIFLKNDSTILSNSTLELNSTLFSLNYYNEMNGNNISNAGDIVLFIYNGTDLQRVYYQTGNCPIGFVSLNKGNCIQANENTPLNFWNAQEYCSSLGGYLCTWSQWYYACQKNALPVLNMTNNWEWIGDANNHATSALILGNGGCTTNGESNTQITTVRPFRCCYTKK